MPQLIVRRIEEKIVKRLKARAGLHGVSMEEEHRQILRQVLLDERSNRPSFKEYLLQMPDAEQDDVFERKRQVGRRIRL